MASEVGLLEGVEATVPLVGWDGLRLAGGSRIELEHQSDRMGYSRSKADLENTFLMLM